MYKYILSILFTFVFWLFLTVFWEHFLVSKEDIIDWDTIRINDWWKSSLVRLIWIDTPEKSDLLYQESIDYLSNHIVWKYIEIIKDPFKEDKDKFGRLLRYVMLDKKNINLALISAGYAKEFLYDSTYIFRKDFLLAQLLAKKSNIWIRINWEKNIHSDCYELWYSIKHWEQKYVNDIIDWKHLFTKQSCDDGIIITEKYIDWIMIK